MRTNEGFRNRVFNNFHNDYFKDRHSSLESLDIDMIKQFPLDPMHLLDLGVCKKLITCLVTKDTITFKLQTRDVELISERLLSLVPYIPIEFVRRPRDLKDLPRWKAVEFRQFLLYTGIVVLKNILNDDFCYHFLLLSCSYKVLLSQNYLDYVDTAENMLKYFVEIYPDLYGPKNATYNTHSVLHIVQCVRDVGNLQSFAAYKFENYLQHLKKKIKKPSKILEQIHKKFYSNTRHFKEPEKNCKERYSNGIVSKYFTKGFMFSKKNLTICVH